MSESVTSKRLKRFQRAGSTHRPALRLTARDYRILLTLVQYQALSTAQIRRLFFGITNKSSSCDSRLKKLFHHDYVNRVPQLSLEHGENKSLVYTGTSQAVRLLRRKEILPGEGVRSVVHPLRMQYIDHLLRTNDVQIAFFQACRLLSLRDFQWRSEADIRADSNSLRRELAKRTAHQLIPDGIVSYRGTAKRYFGFIEVDRATESLSVLRQKFSQYVQQYQTERLSARFGVDDLRVFVVTTTPTRLENMLKLLAELPLGDRFVVTTQEQATAENVFTSAIWYQAGRAVPVSLLRNRQLVDYSDAQKMSDSDCQRKLFVDWWRAHEFEPVEIHSAENTTKKIDEEESTCSALCRYSREEYSLLNFRKVDRRLVTLQDGYILTPKITKQILDKLYT